MKTKTSKVLLLLGLLSLASCGFVPSVPPAAQRSPAKSAPSPRALSNFGLFELKVTGATAQVPAASVISVSPGLRVQGTEIGGVTFAPLSFGTYTDEASRTRYLRASFRVTNNSGQALTVPTYVPVDTDGQNATVGATPFKGIKYFDGSDASARAASIQIDTAHRINSGTGANEVDPDATPLVGNLDTQNLTVSTPAGTTVASVFQQGWQGQALAVGATQVVTFAVQMPMATSASQDPFSFSLVFAVTDNPNSLDNAAYTLQKDRWRNLLVPPSPDTSNPSYISKLEQLNRGAQSNYDTLNKSPGRAKLWDDLETPAENSATISSNFGRILNLAVAYNTPGAALYQNAQLKTQIVSALEWMNTNYYNLTIPETGNWFAWEIGGAKALTDALILMERDMTPQQITGLTDALLRFVPDPKIRVINNVVETGANLMDKAGVFNKIGLLRRDDVKIARARDSISELFDFASSGVGFYADGSYIDHTNFAYTAGYGIVLFSGMAQFLYVSQGSQWAVTNPNVDNVYKWAYNSFEPTLYRGRISDITAGRGVSRGAESDFSRSYGVTTALVYLAQNAPPADAARLKALAKYMIVSDPQSEYYDRVSLPALSLAVQSLSNVASRGEVTFHKQFPAMDRVVHSRNGWMFAIAGSSSRIANYESIIGENLKGWYTGDGAVYFYNATSPNFSSDFWPTVDPYRMPGTTEASPETFSRSALSVNAGKQYLSPNNWTGGSTLGEFGTYGMDFKADGDRQVNGSLARNSTVTARKSYFMFDNEIAMLGAGINAAGGEDVQTTVENRQLGANNQSVSVNGAGFTPGIQAVQSLQIAGVGGYVFLNPQQVNLKKETRSGQWQDINVATSSGGSGWVRKDGVTPTTTVQKEYLTAWIDHGVNPNNATYAYVQLPDATAAQTQAYQQTPDVSVLANTPTVQAVRESALGITAANFFGAGVAGGVIKSSNPASVIYKENAGTVEFGISDPTQTQGQVTIEYNRPANVISSSPNVTVVQTSPNLKIQVNLTGTKGKTVNLRASYDPAAPTVTLTPDAGSNTRTEQLVATEDSYARDGNSYAAQNFDTGKPYVRFASATATGFNCITYLKFSLAALSNVSAAQVDSATLRLYGGFADSRPSPSSSDTTPIQAFGTTGGAWSETTLTWNNRPALASTGSGTAGLTRAAGWIELNVADLVKQARAQGQTELTVALYQPAPSQPAALSQFETRLSSTPPTLVIDYTP